MEHILKYCRLRALLHSVPRRTPESKPFVRKLVLKKRSNEAHLRTKIRGIMVPLCIPCPIKCRKKSLYDKKSCFLFDKIRRMLQYPASVLMNINLY